MIKNNTKIESVLMPAYLFVELCLLIIIKMTENQGHEGMDMDNVFMFIVILLNAAVTLYYYFNYGITRKDRHENLLVLGIIINVFSDFFLSLLDTAPMAIPGVALFCVLETVYAIYLKSPVSWMIARAVIGIAAVAGVMMVGMFSVSNALGVINLAIVTLNVIDAWRCRNHDPGFLFSLGITLFCLGDYAILFRTLLSGVPGDIARFLVWIFYVPATVLIVCGYVKRLKPEISLPQAVNQ